MSNRQLEGAFDAAPRGSRRKKQRDVTRKRLMGKDEKAGAGQIRGCYPISSDEERFGEGLGLFGTGGFGIPARISDGQRLLGRRVPQDDAASIRRPGDPGSAGVPRARYPASGSLPQAGHLDRGSFFTISAFAILGGFSIGFFYIPAAAAVLLAALTCERASLLLS